MPKSHDLPEGVYERRRKKGFTHDEAVAHPSHVRYERPYRLSTGTFPNIREIVAVHPDVKENTIRGRLHLGWSLEKAVFTPARSHRPWFDASPLAPRPDQPKRVAITIDGVPYKSHAAAARAHNVSKATFDYRLLEGYSPEQAAGLAPITGREPIPVTSRVYRVRRERGFTHDEAIQFPRDVACTVPIRLRGSTYPSRAMFRRAFDLSKHEADLLLKENNLHYLPERRHATYAWFA